MPLKATPVQNNPVLFLETQRFSQWWLWLLLALGTSFLIYALIKQIFLHEPVGTHPSPNGILIGIFFVLIILMYFLFVVRLDTKIDTQGVAYRWRPFQKKYRKILWRDIEKANLIKYLFAGFGAHWSSRFGEVHNTGGNRGLLLTFTNQKKMLIGTRQPEKLLSLLQKITPDASG